MSAPFSIFSGVPPLSGACGGRAAGVLDVLHCGRFPREPRWLCGLLAFVGGWHEPHQLRLLPGREGASVGVVVCFSEGRVRSVHNEQGLIRGRATGRLSALDACVQFALGGDPDSAGGGDAGFRYLVAADPVRGGVPPEDLDWPVEHFGMSIGCLFDLLADEEPMIRACGVTTRRFRFAGSPDAALAAAQSEGERLLIAALCVCLAMDGPGVDARQAASLTGISLRTVAALLARLWREGNLTDQGRGKVPPVG